MCSTPTGLFGETADYDSESTPRESLDQLGMSNSATKATERYITSKEQKSGLDERGAQLSARMRKTGKAGLAVSARLYKDAERRAKTRAAAQAQNEEEKQKALEDDMESEFKKWHRPDVQRGKFAPRRERDPKDQKSAPKIVSVFDALYHDHQNREAKMKKKIEDKVVEDQKREAEELKQAGNKKWGAPKISKKAKESQRQGGEIWERISDWDGSQRKKHLEEMRKQQEGDEMAQCTFDIGASIAENPEMGFGGRSSKLVHQMMAKLPPGQEVASNRFEALYNDARQRQLRIEQYENWYPEDQTFNPDIGPDKYRPRIDETEEEFINRLTYHKQQRMLEQPLAMPEVDQSTGQKLFQPVTGRAPLFQRNASGLPIGDYLHSYAYEKRENQEYTMQEYEQQSIEIANKSKVSANSNAIMENMRHQQLFEIFSVIDQDGDGIIDPAAADAAARTRLPPEIANDICPLVIESGTAHNFDSFYTLCRDAVSSARAGPKGYLVPERERHMRSVDEYVHSRQPVGMQVTLSEKSQELADDRRAQRTGSLYDVLAEEREVWEMRRRNMSEKRAGEDLAACTFQPNVERRGLNPPMSTEVAQRLAKPTQSVKAF